MRNLASLLKSNYKNTLSSSFTRPLLSVFLAQSCPVCDRNASSSKNRTTPTQFCIDCQRQIESACHPCEGWQTTVENSLAIGELGGYHGTLKQAVLSLKYKNRPDVAHSLGIALAKRWKQQTQISSANLYVLPIPLHPNRLTQRGYNQAELIANAFSRASGLTTLAHGLLRTQDTLPQHQLGLGDRQKNLQSAFAVGRALHKLRRRTKAPLRILLIDDIYTTGATAQSAAQTLRAANIRVTGMLTLARAMTD